MCASEESEERRCTVRSSTAPDCVRRFKNGEECQQDMQKVDRDAKRVKRQDGLNTEESKFKEKRNPKAVERGTQRSRREQKRRSQRDCVTAALHREA